MKSTIQLLVIIIIDDVKHQNFAKYVVAQ